METSITKSYLSKLGFDEESILILESLFTHDKQSVLELSRDTGIERTKVYRLIDELLKNGFVVVVKGYKRNYYKIAPIEKFENEKDKFNKMANELVEDWAKFAHTISSLNTKQNPTSVNYYRGVNGIKQVLWNELKAQDKLYSFTYRNLVEIVGLKFFREWEDEFEERGLVCLDLRTQEFEKSDVVPAHRGYNRTWDQIRYLPKNHPHMTLAVDIYNDTVVVYDWRDNDIFAVEIQNQKFADFMKVVFKSFWQQAKPAKWSTELRKRTPTKL